MRLVNWRWTKRNGAWYSTTPNGDDQASISTLSAMSRSSRFLPGGGGCPTV